ncbi:10403_t:CDS:1 [Acaulospora morrowiae]|uniref:10403_t:CDS:1 n=1 Tax=Acaulospora morrowiae TaxID=94023 RepID=A0A9N8ZLH7_9GLOM|nr:10403_t:CDS:1 [Acaulospora morrowiae]
MSKKFAKNSIKPGQKSTRGRKALITPDKTDVTGKQHFMIVRRVNNQNSIIKNKHNNGSCGNCDLNDEYFDFLTERVNTIEGLVNNLRKTLSIKRKPSNFGHLDFKRMDTDTLLKYSEIFSLYPQQSQPLTLNFNIQNDNYANQDHTLRLWNNDMNMSTESIFYI